VLCVQASAAGNTRELERLEKNLLGNFPNTYTLTKAMSEALLCERRGSVPLVIVRPTIVGSSLAEPVPGWVDNVAAAGAVFFMTGMGVLQVLPGHPDGVADIIPVDLVARSILLSAPGVARGGAGAAPPAPAQPPILHAGSSGVFSNQMRWTVPIEHVTGYFAENRPAQAVRACRFAFIENPRQFELAWKATYTAPGKAVEFASRVVPSLQKNARLVGKVVDQAASVVELFKPFTMNEWFFLRDFADALEASLVGGDGGGGGSGQTVQDHDHDQDDQDAHSQDLDRDRLRFGVRQELADIVWGERLVHQPLTAPPPR
jgi:hypothetical protein